jgi:hypothetical protein
VQKATMPLARSKPWREGSAKLWPGLASTMKVGTPRGHQPGSHHPHVAHDPWTYVEALNFMPVEVEIQNQHPENVFWGEKF